MRRKFQVEYTKSAVFNLMRKAGFRFLHLSKDIHYHAVSPVGEPAAVTELVELLLSCRSVEICVLGFKIEIVFVLVFIFLIFVP